MAKVSVSVSDNDLRWLKSRARRLYAGNVSAVVAEGTRLLRHNEALGKLLDDLGAPELSPAELQQVDGEMQSVRPPRTGKRRERAA